MRRKILVLALGCFVISGSLSAQTPKPKIAFDEFFNSVGFTSVAVSPDGNSVVVGAERADWEQQIFRKELWLYRIAGNGGTLVQLTQSGHDSGPQWSPDGQWIAFFSERKAAGGKDGDADDKEKDVSQLFLISPNGGEAFPVISGEQEVHAFAWSSDSKAIYFATRQPWTKQQNDDHKKDWKDVVQFRGDERGDVVFKINLDEALARYAALGTTEAAEAVKDSGATPGAVTVAHTPLHVEQIAISHDGSRLAFVSTSPSERNEKVEEYELYTVSLANPSPETAPSRLTRNEAEEVSVAWASDNLHLFFRTSLGSVDGKYEDLQPRLYWIDTNTGALQRWFAEYKGEVVHYTPLPDGSVLCACRLGTEVQYSSQANPKAPIVKREGWAGAYERPASALKSSRLAFAYSAFERPTEVYIADGPDKLAQGRPITSFNKLFVDRDLPKGKPYRWTSEDGTPVEGWLVYPPGKFEAKNLPMFVLIHGGPQDADGNHFEADWYQWDRLAATQGWLVFEPNYRGSTGYGDKFALQIVPQIVSLPGKDILTGVDALVKDGIANPDQLAIGGYSYGGYMTNWLITQTTRFKAAVTGAGAVEHIANWGNDDTGFDDVYFLGGHPWEVPDRYRSEGAIFQINKVRTPTHMVGGADDIRVAVLEDYLLDRALHELNIPSDLLIFPGEGHSLSKNPWHGKIKVREELKWLSKYGGVGGTN
jgi:dipeptidyl aminopeptidase/acylaminoacyl peptidase